MTFIISNVETSNSYFVIVKYPWEDGGVKYRKRIDSKPVSKLEHVRIDLLVIGKCSISSALIWCALWVDVCGEVNTTRFKLYAVCVSDCTLSEFRSVIQFSEGNNFPLMLGHLFALIENHYTAYFLCSSRFPVLYAFRLRARRRQLPRAQVIIENWFTGHRFVRRRRHFLFARGVEFREWATGWRFWNIGNNAGWVGRSVSA